MGRESAARDGHHVCALTRAGERDELYFQPVAFDVSAQGT
jgi:hypothetical protein